MHRNISAVTLLSLLVITLLTASLAFSANAPVKRFHERASFPARLAPTFGALGVEDAQFATPKSDPVVALGEMDTRAVGTQIGVTTYDYQSNCTMGRQAEHRGYGYVHFDWMIQTDNDYGAGDRGVGVESYNLTTCNLVYGNGGKRASTNRAGYVTIDADISGCAIPSAHEVQGPVYPALAYFDFCAGGPFGLFSTDAPSDIFGFYQNNGTGPNNENAWPKIEWQLGTETVLHMVATESGGAAGDPQTISYIRRVGPYGAGSGVWSHQRIIDTIENIAPTVTASAISDKVAIAWYAPCDYVRDQGTAIEFANQYENDVWYATCSDQGQSWANDQTKGSIGHEVELGTVNGDNITTYDSMSTWKAYCDISALITSDENLHVVWSCRKWDGDSSLFRRQSGIFHWSEDVPFVRTVVRAEWDTGGTCFGHVWNNDVTKMSISECDGKLYVLYTQFGNADAPCYDFDADNNVVNGELYLTVSNNNGLNWDEPQNLTNSVTHDCAAGDCESDMWASMARYGREEVCGALTGQNVLDVLYINDRAAGGAVTDVSGVWTTNPVMWLTTPCRDVVAVPDYNDDADSAYGHCYGNDVFFVQSGSDTTLTITLENTGLLDNNFSISVTYTDGAGWITPTPAAGVISAGLNNTIDVDFLIAAPTGAPEPSIWEAEIQITHDADGSPRVIPICILVDDSYDPPATVDLATTCKQIRLWNTGELVGDSPGYALGYTDDCDTFNVNTASNVYLYDGSPIITRIDGTDTLRFTMYSKTYLDPDGMIQVSPITVSTADPDYTLATYDFMTGDSTIGFTAEYYAPTSASDCDFVIEKLSFYSLSSTVYNGVLVGEFIDWDVPSDSGSENGSGYDFGRQMIYQSGAEYNQDDSTEALCPQESDDRYAAIAFNSGIDITDFKNAMTLNNATYVYPEGPYGDAAPLPPGAMYDLMSGAGYSTWSTTAPESTYTDLSTLVTFGEYDLGTAPKCIIKILATTKDGLTDLEGIVDAANAFIDAQEIVCNTSCCVMPGNANDDAAVNVGDAVYIINYVFKGGPTPPCIDQANANADAAVNVGDAVYIINYVFKGGPAPQCP